MTRQAGAMLGMLFLVHAAVAQFTQQGSKLVGTGAAGAASQGASVAISADGNTAIVGGWGDNHKAGAAWVFTRSGGVWSQQGSKLVGSGAVGAAWQGISVAISADGNTAIVGGPFDDSEVGAAWVFTRSGGVWLQEGGKLVGTGAVGPKVHQGWSVAISANGNTAVVGGYSDNDSVGAVWVFTRSGGVWSQQGRKLVGSGAVGAAQQGTSVAISADGNTAIVGGPFDEPVGAVWVYTRSGVVWSEQGGKLVGISAAGAASQGASVAISADGSTAIVGADNGNVGTGAAWVFARSGGMWSQQGGRLVGTGAVARGPFPIAQGHSVAISADGNTALVGGPIDNAFDGAVWVYTRSKGAWSQLGAKLVGTGGVRGAQQGTSVAISADGSTVIVGGHNESDFAGAARVFTRGGGK